MKSGVMKAEALRERALVKSLWLAMSGNISPAMKREIEQQVIAHEKRAKQIENFLEG